MLANPPLISIVTVCFNSAATIEATLASVAAQTYPHINYIVIDGGSTDGTVDLIRRYAAHISDWVSEKDRGISHAFNKGVLLAKGDYVIILSSDDAFADPEAVAEAVRHIQETGADAVSGAVILVDGEKRTLIYGNRNLRHMVQDMAVHHQTLFVRRTLFDEFGPFAEDLKLAMDYEFALRLFLAGKQFSVMDRIITLVGGQGASHRNYLMSRREVYRVHRRNGFGTIRALYIYLFTVVRYRLRLFFEAIGLKTFVDFFRRHYSVTRKIPLTD